MPTLITKTVETKLTAEPGERAVIARISSTVVDRDGDVMLPSGLDAKDFRQNPAVLLAHDQGRLPIGKAIKVTTTSREVHAKIQFAERPASHPPGAEWIPDTVMSLFQQDMPLGFSVGFTIEDSRPAQEKDAGRFGDGVRRIISKWKLLELSVVPVPANQEALALAVSKSWLKGHWSGLEVRTTITLDRPDAIRIVFERQVIDLSK